MSEVAKDLPPEDYPYLSGAAVYESIVRHLQAENDALRAAIEALRAERDYWRAQADAAYRDENPEDELPPAA